MDDFHIKNGSRGYLQIYGDFNVKEYFAKLKDTVGNMQPGSSFPYDDDQPGRERLIVTNIPAEYLAAAKAKAKLLGATVNDLLLTACYKAYGNLEEVDAAAPVGIQGIMDMRARAKDGESEGLANLSGTMSTALKDGIGSFEDVLKEITAQTSKAKSDSLAGMEAIPFMHILPQTIPLGLMLRIAEKAYGSILGLSMTNMGLLKSADLTLGQLQPVSAHFGSVLKKKPSFQVSAITMDGVCSLSVCIQATNEDEEKIQNFLNDMAAELVFYSAI